MVYLDYNASTPIDKRVLPLVAAAGEKFGNPSSSQHPVGQAAAELIGEARARVARMIGRPTQDIVFTSGASEAAVLGIVGAMLGDSGRPNVVVGATEHKAILAAAGLGARLTGGTVRSIGVDRMGIVDLDQARCLVDDTVGMVAVMAANNETGVLAPTAEISEIARGAGALNFVDITQLVGKAPLDAVQNQADLMVCSSHKIYGPKGAGALIASRHIQERVKPIMAGGGQERGLRGGTQNTSAIAGFGAAAELVDKEHSDDAARLAKLSDRLLSALQQIDGVVLNSQAAQRVSNTLNLRFIGADAEAVMASMPNIAVSNGSACQAAVTTPSHVLLAMGMGGDEAAESIRISLGRPTTTAEIDMAAQEIVAAVARVRALTGNLRS